MPKFAVELDLRQIERMIAQLKAPQRIALIQRLERKAWGERFRALTARVDKRRKKYPLSRKELLRLVKEARQERYASGRS